MVSEQPNASRVGCGVMELHDDASSWQLARVHPPMPPPHEMFGADVIRVEVVVHPVHRPSPERHENGSRSLPAGVRWYSLPRPLGDGHVDDSLAFEMFQPLHEQRARDARKATNDVIEPGVAEHQFADDQWRPTIGDSLACHGHWAEGSVVGHSRSSRRQR